MNKWKSITAAMIGNALEYYDVMLYGFFAMVISPLYFPSADPLTSRLSALGAFGLGFLARPLGGLIFGHIGDKYGRKKALIISILLATVPTFTIGILPTYETIGLLAPLVLIFCRLLQGLCTSGEYSGAAILIAEYSEQNKSGFACSLLPASSLIGALAGTTLGALVTLEGMPPWAWRIPFLLSFLVGIFGFYLRTRLAESPVFKEVYDHHQVEKYPLVGLLKTQKNNFFCSMAVGASQIAFFYISTTYIIGLSGTSKGAISSHQSMLLNTGLMLMMMISLPFMGYISDKVGIRRLMLSGTMLTIIFSLPLFWFLHQEISTLRIIIAMLILACLTTSFVGPGVAFLAHSLFPVQERYTGVALGVSLGEALFGAITPITVSYLMTLTDNGIAPALYLMLCSFIGWLGVRNAKIQEVTHHPV